MTEYTSAQFDERPDRAIVVSLSTDQNGRGKLFLDDARRQSRVGSGVGWETVFAFTETEIDTERLLNGRLSTNELAMIGENILLRLVSGLEL